MIYFYSGQHFTTRWAILFKIWSQPKSDSFSSYYVRLSAFYSWNTPAETTIVGFDVMIRATKSQ